MLLMFLRVIVAERLKMFCTGKDLDVLLAEVQLWLLQKCRTESEVRVRRVGKGRKGLVLREKMRRRNDATTRNVACVVLPSLHHSTDRRRLCLQLLCVQVMTARIIERGRSSGRIDDNEEAIRKRLVTYRESTMPIIREFETRGKLREVNSDQTIGKERRRSGAGGGNWACELYTSSHLRENRARMASRIALELGVIWAILSPHTEGKGAQKDEKKSSQSGESTEERAGRKVRDKY